MSNPLDNTSTADIRAELDTIVENLSEWMYRAAVLLVELRARKEHHPLMNSTTLRYFKQIAAGTLDPAMVLAVGGNKNIVRPLAKLPVKEQLGYAKDRPVQVVERSDDGGDVVREKPVMQLSPAALEQVFGEDGIRSTNEQRRVRRDNQDESSATIKVRVAGLGARREGEARPERPQTRVGPVSWGV